MAVSKIWPLYQTMDKAIKYICNPEKTEDGTLIDTYQCTERFADMEFKDVAAKARSVKKPRIGYHTMISFAPDDPITLEKALELGKEIMDKYTGGRYQYVLTVHTDQKHLHVHCIINSVSYKDYRKLQIKDKDLDRLEKITDRICKANGLSVIEEKSGVKGRKKYEDQQHKQNASWKSKLIEAIDRTILVADSYEDFLERMRMEEGYQIKEGKYLSFLLEHEGQQKSVRNRTLGEFYSIDSIKDRINNKEKYADRQTERKEKVSEKSKLDSHSGTTKTTVHKQNKSSKENGKIRKIIDVSKNEKAQNIAAYRKKLNMINIDTYAGMMQFVKKHHLIYAEDFERVKNELETKYSLLTDELKKVYGELNELEADLKQFQKFLDNKKSHEQYETTSDKDKKYDLSLANKKYESAVYYFKKNGINIKNVTPENLQQILKKIDLCKTKVDQIKSDRREIKENIKQLSIIQQNNEQLLGSEFTHKETQSPHRENSQER